MSGKWPRCCAIAAQWMKMSALCKKLFKFREDFELRQKHCTNERTPFFEIVEEYLPKNKKEIIIDIGSGDGSFAEILQLRGKGYNYYLLDANDDTIDYLRFRHEKVIKYAIPDSLPFNNESIFLIHCSHVIEHLTPMSFYKFLSEINRTLKFGGIFVVSAPLMWRNFYHDLSHLKPYYPETMLRYLSQKASNYTFKPISSDFALVRLIYRYYADALWGQGLGSKYFILDSLIRVFRYLFRTIGIVKYEISGFTLVLKKEEK